MRWVNDGRNNHNVTPDSGKCVRQQEPRSPGSRTWPASPTPGRFAYYCTLHGAPARGSTRDLVVGDATSVTRVAPVGASDAAAPTIAASGRTIRVPADAKTIQAGVDRAKPGDLVLVSPGVYTRASPSATNGIVLRGVEPQQHDPRRRVQARQRREGRRRRRRGGREPHRPELHRERLLLDRRARDTAARTSPRTATATTASSRSTRSTGCSSTPTRRAAPTPASTSASAIRATRSSPT